MADEDLDQVMQQADVQINQPDKFGDWFEQNFDCNKKKGNLICDIEGENMKVTNTVRQSEYREGERADMIKAVKENHQINKGAGISYGDD